MIEIPDSGRTAAVMENVARISADYMGTLVDILSGRFSDSRTIIEGYVIPWAYEAEDAYQATIDERAAKGDYLDWLDAFVQNKIDELRKESGGSGSLTVGGMLCRVRKCDNPDGVEVRICLNGEEYVPARNAYFSDDVNGKCVFVIDNTEGWAV